MTESEQIAWQNDGATDAWPARSANGRARRAALHALEHAEHTATSVVSYQAADSLLLICDDSEYAVQVIEALDGAGLDRTLLVVDGELDEPSRDELAGVERVRGRASGLNGHLGAFTVAMRRGGEDVDLSRLLGRERKAFDLVLDLCTAPMLRQEVPPPGYRAPRNDEDLAEALEELPALRGEFDKPKYFEYDPDICAHASSRLTGCTRCLDACPTEAISSLQDMIEVDPYLCQGGGVCASACPTSAITYQFPRVSELLESLRGALRRFRENGGESPVILLHDDAGGREAVEAAAGELPDNVLPLRVEEVGATGLDTWLAGLCYGAGAVCLAATPQLPQRVRTELRHQVGIGNRLLAGLGVQTDRIEIVEVADGQWWRERESFRAEPIAPPAGFAAFENKRTTLDLALDHLHANTPEKPERVTLPSGSPFGEIRIDRDACTLCMGCVSVCPAAALADGGDHPAVKLVEGNCVQCGICAQACPEDAITLLPGYCFDDAKRRRMRVLNEEEPFCCVNCGKPFATKSMMERIESKLAGHWMYQDPKQRERLQMCENCRVDDLFRDDKGLDPHAKPSMPGN